MRKALIPVLAAIAVIPLFVTGCGSNIHDGVNMKNKVGFGAVVPNSGPYRQIGAEYFRGLSVAEHSLNGTGGVVGKEVKVVIYDSAGEPEKGLDDVRRFTRDFDMKFIAVALPRVVDKSSAELADHDEVVTRLEGGPSPEKKSAYTLRAFVSGEDEAKLMAETAGKEKLSKILILATEDRYGDKAGAVAAEESTKAGATRVDRLPLRYNTAEEIETKARETAYDAVFIFGHGPEIPPALLALRKAGHRGVVIGNHAFAGKTITLLDSSILRDIRFTATEFDTRNDRPMSVRFRDEYRALNRAEPDLFSAFGYDQLMLVITAAKAVDSTKSKVVYSHILEEKTYEGAAGSYKFDEKGEAHLDLTLSPVLQAKSVNNPAK